jgi:hypothetical protein
MSFRPFAREKHPNGCAEEEFSFCLARPGFRATTSFNESRLMPLVITTPCWASYPDTRRLCGAVPGRLRFSFAADGAALQAQA